MGNILIDMMGLLSRKRVVKTYEDTDMLVLGRRPNADDSIFNTPKMHNELISIKDLRAQFDTGEVTGSGTTGFLPVYKDGPNSVIGDSQLREGQLGNGLYQMRFENADRFIINKPSSVVSGDPEYLVQQDGQYKTSFGWDDDGGGFAFLYNYSGAGIKIGAAGSNPMIEIKTAEGAKEVNLHESVKFDDYGSGTKTGTAAYNLSVDSSGKVIETAVSGGGGISQTTGTITPSVSAGISGISYNHQFGYWTRTGNMVDVFLSVSIGPFTKTDVTQKLIIEDAFPYDIHIQRQFFNGDLLSYVNISDSGTAIPALYIANPDISGAAAYDIQFIRSANYTLTTTNTITTNEMSTGSFAVELSFRYRCTDSTTLRSGASIDS
tara:strand:- start:643 stop:1776 length:1134 start_codon:yes stop_codon:yes gene_type:complete